MPAELVPPCEDVPAELVPAELVPAELVVFEEVPAELVPVEVVLLLVPLEATEESLGLELLSALLLPPTEDVVVPQEARPNRAALRRTTY